MTDLKEHWADRLRFVGVVVEDDDYHIWGSSPIWGDDGKVHVFASRIPVETGFDKWWATSQIAHYGADRPEGPFSLVEVLLEPGQTPLGSWDSGTQHNPTITKIDDLYVLTYHSSTSTVHQRVRPSQRIGMLTATDLKGPWQKLGKILDPPTAEESQVVPQDYNGGTDNPALIKHPDGRFFLYYRIKFPGLEGENTYAVAIADDLEGPYRHHPGRVVNNPTYIEDPYVFQYRDLIYMLVTDVATSGGLLLTSVDGLHFNYSAGVKGFGPMSEYMDGVPTAPAYRAPKFERPQLLLKDGRPTHLYAPGGTNINGGKGTCCYLFEVQSGS